MPSIDLSFLAEDPSAKTEEATLTIEALAPLSMNTSVPGKHYQTATEPPLRQIYGLFENAMGLHFGWRDSYKVRQEIADDAAADVKISGSDKRDFQPLLEPYYDLTLDEAPTVETFDDTQWAHKWRDSGTIRNGAMHHDWRATLDKASNYGYGKTIIEREHVVADGPWIYRLRAAPMAMDALANALSDPAGQLYLGNNDGWVDVTLRR
jgi:CRISPR-associated protein Cas5